MNATVAPTARPPGAAIAWVHKGELYIEYPTKTGQPYIMRQHRTVEGIASALGILIENPAPNLTTNPANHPAITRTHRQTEIAARATDEQRANAVAVLRRLGLK